MYAIRSYYAMSKSRHVIYKTAKNTVGIGCYTRRMMSLITCNVDIQHRYIGTLGDCCRLVDINEITATDKAVMHAFEFNCSYNFV